MFFGSLLISCCCCLLLVSGTDVVFNMDGANATISTLEAKIKKLEKTIANLKGEQVRKVSRPTSSADVRVVAANATHVTTFVVLGASGHLAKTKTFPALFQIFVNDLLPNKFSIFGYARSAMTREEFQAQLRPFLKGDEAKINGFLALCYYYAGPYDEKASFAKLHEALKAHEGGPSNRIFYMALPPTVFLPAARSIQPEAMSVTGWNRIIIEKPFGSDYESAVALGNNLADIFDEDQMFRIDHYLGKEMVQNILTLRFANLIFEPIWTRLRIKSVSITFKENFGTEGRGGYFDGFGIIRDVMQNHLLQILSLIAMEPPSSLEANDIRDAKLVLRQVQTIKMDDVVLGQYTRSEDGSKPAYLDDETVPKGSRCPTYAVAVLHIDNERWSGVPFIMKAGKALEERKAEIRIQFQEVRNHLFPSEETVPNELVFRVQPDEAVYLKVISKEPGLTNKRIPTELDLTYKHRYTGVGLPEAYTVLILDAIRGDQGLFVRNDELLEAWRIFTPLLHQIEDPKSSITPIPYAYGTRGPAEGELLRKRHGLIYHEGYRWDDASKSYTSSHPPFTDKAKM